MPRTGKCLYRRKDGRWEGRYIKSYSQTGKAVYGSVYARTCKEAKEKLEQARLSNPNLTIEAPKEDGADSSQVFQDVAAKWLDSIQLTVKESTSVKYLNLLETYINPILGVLPVESMTVDDIDAHCTKLLTEGGVDKKGLSPKTVMSVLSVIRTVLEYANQNGLAVNCDTKGIKVKQNNKEMRVLTQNEQEKLCSYICQNVTSTNLGILICLYTGLRLGEICALRWEDISLPEQTIHVHQTMQRIQDKTATGQKTKVIITTPKSSCSIRTIPIPNDLADLIRSHGVQKSGYFLTDSETSYLEPRTMENRFKRVLDVIEADPINFHALRHTFATKCVELGFDVKTLSVILGHASVNITMNRYVHPTMKMKKENMGRISIPILVK